MNLSRRLVVLFLLVGFLFGHLGRFFWPGTILGRINLLDLALAAAVVWALMFKQKFLWPRWLVAFLLLAALSFFIGLSVFGLAGQPESWLFLLRLVLYGLFFAVAPALFVGKGESLIVWLGGLVAILGFIQLKVFSAIPISFITEFGFDPHAGRLFATWFDPNLAGAILLVTIIVTLAALYRRFSWPFLLSFLLQAGAILATQSRSALLALVVALGFFWLTVNKKYLLLFISLGMVVLLLSPSLAARVRSGLAVDATSQARFASWETAFLVIDRTPILGVGYNNYQTATMEIGRYQPRIGQIALAANASDSSLLTIWATVGLAGLLAWLLFLLTAAAAPRPTLERGTVLAVVAGLLVDSLFINTLLFAFVLFLLAIVFTYDKKTAN